ncbi:hypothetical protein D9758_004410 [Tetrapyrgos nigripes]|uniref:Uncharacterized protein n=1 Tax=Tetrapyrgos nigripes TaxID=182062 RepID=A0A8H5LS63_9AGAR|nr:hypothetical protein D9758_004410 [Tetrapyrgos nigripes]
MEILCDGRRSNEKSRNFTSCTDTTTSLSFFASSAALLLKTTHFGHSFSAFDAVYLSWRRKEATSKSGISFTEVFVWVRVPEKGGPLFGYRRLKYYLLDQLPPQHEANAFNHLLSSRPLAVLIVLDVDGDDGGPKSPKKSTKRLLDAFLPRSFNVFCLNVPLTPVMFRFSRFSRQPTPEVPNPNIDSPAESESFVEVQGDTDEPSPSSPNHMSKDSEGYPSWLPQRPPPPVPASTIHGSIMTDSPAPTPAPTDPSYFMGMGGRKPTPRSVRVVSMQQGDEKEPDPTDQTRGGQNRIWSRAMASALSPTVFSGEGAVPTMRLQQPKFRSRGTNFDLLRNPSITTRIYFYLYPILVFAHIPLQTFFDFNAAFMLIQVSKFPDPEAPGVPGHGRNWALGAAAYIACWFTWILVVVIYELVYSFIRRWRTKRPAIYPIYMSAPAFTFASLTSYTHFCFLHHVRYTAFFGETGSIRDGLAETFYFYSQNLPTIALLLPRAALALALLLTFSSPSPNVVALADAGISRRDPTFFRVEDGTLTGYARGVLIANAAWAAWRALVLIGSWLGLWILSGQGFGGLCGPRYRWEEEDQEKSFARASVYSDNLSDIDRQSILPWSWRDRTRLRITDAYEFCLVSVRPTASRWGYGQKRDPSPDASALLGNAGLPSPGGFEGIDKLMAAVGLPSAVDVEVRLQQQQQRRNILSDDFFRTPVQTPGAGPSGTTGRTTPPDLAAVIPKVVQRASREPSSTGPLTKLPYPFSAAGGAAQVSSEDERIPFPPSPSVPSFKESSTGSGRRKRRSPGQTSAEEHDEEAGEAEEEEEDEEDDEEEEEDTTNGTSEDPSSERASGSMSSLGRPVSSRYPFQFRQPTRGGASYSSGTRSNVTHSHSNSNSNSHNSNSQSNGRSIASGVSHTTHSTRYRESTDSHSPRSLYTSGGSSVPSPTSMRDMGLPMPPRHPQGSARQGRGRARAGTIPSPSVASSPSVSVDFPRRSRARTRGDSETYSSIRAGVAPGRSSPEPEPAVYSSDLEREEDDFFDDDADESGMMEQPEPEGSQEAAENDDQLGLLTPSQGPSPKSSFTALRTRASTLSSGHRRSFGSSSGSGSRSGDNSRTNSHSGSSSGRSRTNSISMAITGARSRAQSLLQNVGSASRSSLELAVRRSRANSSMARLEEDSPYFSDRTGSHSRSGSGSDALENYTFGQPIPGNPLRTQWRNREDRVVEEEPQSPTSSRASGDVPAPRQTEEQEHEVPVEPIVGSAHALRPSQSNLSAGTAPSLFASSAGYPPSLPPSEPTLHGHDEGREPEPSGGLAIPGSAQREASPPTSTSSPPDISTAAASFITGPATIEGATTDDSGRTVSSWGDISHMVDRAGGTWRPA